MTGGSRRDTRWFIAVLAGALLASALVVYALVRVTTLGGDGSGIAATALTGDGPPSRTAGAPESGTAPGSADTSQAGQASPSPTADDGTPPPTHPYSATLPVPSTTHSVLPQSGVVLPAAWTGAAKVTITVLGDCATGNSSVYADLPADLALDLVQNEANAAQTPVPAGADADDVTLTLGVNSSGVPSLALYSSQINESGELQRLWDLSVTDASGRTPIDGTLVAQPADGSTPNMMVDSETSLQPCESAGTVSLPRALADGATLSGWVSATSAAVTLHGTTTDGKRTVTVEIAAHRTE